MTHIVQSTIYIKDVKQMLAATHMLAGAAVYKSTKSWKWLGLPLAFASHFILDWVPHYDLNIMQNFWIGMPIILFVLFIGLKNKDLFLVVAAFLGALPDIISILQLSDAFHQFHMAVHFEPYYPLPLYLLVMESGIAVLFFVYLWKKRAINL